MQVSLSETSAKPTGGLSSPNLNAAPKTPENFWLVSLTFWGTLLIAAMIYASVALSPKFCVWNRVRLQHQQNAARLSSLEFEVAYLERVERALETDPEFRSQAAGVAIDRNSQSEFIPVSTDLVFGSKAGATQPAAHQVATIPTYHRLAKRLASDQKLRAVLLILTVALTFFAFAVLNDAGTEFVVSSKHVILLVLGWPFRRYRKPVQIEGGEPKQMSVQGDSRVMESSE